MPKLTDTQLILLSAAIQRGDGSLLPHPPTLAATPAEADKAIAQLVKRGFIEERQNADAANSNAANSHRDDGERSCGMFITEAGKAAIGIVDEDPDPEAGPAPQPEPEPQPQPQPQPQQESVRPSKRSAVVELLHRDQGATLAVLIELTSWLPHTTRAALTGLRHKGYVITRAKRGTETCYHILGVV